MIRNSPYWDADRATYEDELTAFVERTVFGRCREHGTVMTAQRNGDPECTDCYVDSLRAMPNAPESATRRLNFTTDHHGRFVITDEFGKGI